MAQIIAADLSRLSPVDEELINANFRNFREELQGIKYEYEAKFDELDDVSVIALSNKFSYLTNDFFFNVVGYFETNGADEWTDRDVESLKRLIAMNEVPVVISQWQPPEKIATAIEESGSKLVILTAMDPGLTLDHLELDPDGLLKLFRKNLASVLAGFNVGH